MQIYLARSRDLSREILNSVYDILVTEDGPMDFRICDKYCRFKDDVLTWPRIFSEISSLRDSLDIDNNDFVILLITKRNNNNWFSGWDESGRRSIFVHGAEWQSYLSCDEIYPIAY